MNSRAPTSIRDQDSLVSFESTELIYRRLSCEDDLFTAGVYNRNFRNRKIGGFFHDSAKARGKKVAELAPVDRPARDDEEDDNEHQPNTTEMQDGQARRCDLIEFSTKLSPDTSGFEVISPNQLVLDSPAPWSSISNGARTPDSSPTSDMSWTFTGSSERPEVSTRGTSLIASSQASICPIWLASNTLTNSLVSCRACDRNFKENPQDLESNMQRHLRYPLKHNTSAGLRCPQSECRRRPAMRSENLGPHLQNFQEMSSASERTVIIDESKLSARRERT